MTVKEMGPAVATGRALRIKSTDAAWLTVSPTGIKGTKREDDPTGLDDPKHDAKNLKGLQVDLLPRIAAYETMSERVCSPTADPVDT
jgi:hypothetical protein